MSSNRYPIIYVRGYAMTEAERDDTAADPFCGFNVGSTVYRATVKKDAPAQKFVFESPVMRPLADPCEAGPTGTGLCHVLGRACA